MNLRKAKTLRVGDMVIAPRVGMTTFSAITRIVPDDDPRVQLLLEVDGHKYPMNYKLVQDVRRA